MATATRKRPPELRLSGGPLEGASTGTPMNSARQRVPLSLSPEQKRKIGLDNSLPRRARKKEQVIPLRSRLQRRLVTSATAANTFLEVHLRRHGRYISRHPVRTLLLACLLITSLFYPAAGIYLWASKGGPGVTRGDARSVWRSLSTPFLDSFASSGRKHHNSLRDLRMVWDDAADLRAMDARDADAYLGSVTPLSLLPYTWPTEEKVEQKERCRSVRVEHVFVTTDDVMMGLGARYGVLDTPILQSGQRLQDTIESYLTGKGRKVTCVKASQSSECLTLSPLSFWQRDAQLLAADSTPTATLLGSSFNITSQGIPLSLTTTFAGRSHLFAKLPRADHLALTFFLEDEEDCRQTASGETLSKSHEDWLSMLRNITGGQVGILSSEIVATKEVVLQFMPVQSSNTFITQRLLLAIGYIAVFVWLTRSLMKIQNVHSRFGLAFTGVVELIISMTLAISICALCGVRLTLVPWEILPFVVVVIGSENMFVLTNAIISTPISLSVSSRVATGLEKVGVPIAVTVMSDVLLMTVIMMLVDVRAVREFCIFAIFSLIVDFFMQMTLYTTVLSIDLQRLELADLLSQGGPNDSSNTLSLHAHADNESITSDPAASLDGFDEFSSQRNHSGLLRHKTQGGKSFIKMSCRTMWRARTARTASLSLLLAFMFGIYLYHGSGFPSHHSYPFLAQNSSIHPATVSATTAQTNHQATPAFDPYSHLSHNDTLEKMTMPWWHKSPSATFWQALNPTDASSVRIKVEPWTVLSLRSTKTFEGSPRNVAHFASWAIFRPRVRAIIWFFKLVVLPISGTTGLLWVLLLYLLKDTELLEAQQNHSDGTGGGEDEEEEAVEPREEESKSELETALRLSGTSHSSDVELSKQSGGFVVTLATDSSLSVWKPSKRGKSSTVILSAIVKEYSRVTAMEVDAEFNLIAIGHASGSVSLWTLTSLQPIELNEAAQEKGRDGRPSTRTQSLLILPSATEQASVISSHRDGSIWRWTRSLHQQSPLMLVPAQLGAVWMAFPPLSSHGTCPGILALSSSDYRFQLYRFSNDEPLHICLLAIQVDNSVVRSASLTTLLFGDEDRSRGSTWSSVVLGTSRGSVLVYDLASHHKVGQYDILDGPVTMIRAIDFVSACPSLPFVGNRDVVIVNSDGHATIMTLSTLAHIPSPMFSASKSPPSTPSKKKNGQHSAPLVALPDPNTPAKGSERDWETSPKSAGTHMNGFASNVTNGTLLSAPGTSMSSPAANGTSFSPSAARHRRRSSQGRRRPSEMDLFLGGEQPLPSSSTNGSASDHLDLDPFDLHSTTQLQWARLASLECERGGADLVMGIGGAKVFGARRKPRQGMLSFSFDSRWEAFQLDVDVLFLDRKPDTLLEVGYVKQCRLELEDGVQYEAGGVAGAAEDANIPLRSTHFPSSTRRTAPVPTRVVTSPLSFTRLDRVEAFYKERVGVDSHKRKKRTVIFTFANTVAALISFE
ncbi:hypothetical protein CBS101457_004708 [Exobasidium rhododendri]|nr:hypothetical protein CBS101457_004708 [Exobasidium rhododendri]